MYGIAENYGNLENYGIISGGHCGPCGAVTLIYENTGRCVRCAKLLAPLIRAAARGAPVDSTLHPMHIALIYDALIMLGPPPAPPRSVGNSPCLRCGFPGIRGPGGKCLGCGAGRSLHRGRLWALLNGKRSYTPRQPCSVCGKHSRREAATGNCMGCNRLTPRQLAQARGEQWYRSGKACKECGEEKPRRECQGQGRCWCGAP